MTSTSIKVMYPGTPVGLGQNGELKGIIISVTIRPGLQVSYKVEWWDGAIVRNEDFYGFQLWNESEDIDGNIQLLDVSLHQEE